MIIGKGVNKMKKMITSTNILILFMTLLYVFVTIFSDVFTYAENFGLCGTEICDNGFAFYRNITNLFMHWFILHLVANMVGLYFSGNLLEKITNKITLICSFLILGVLGGIITNFLYPLIDTTYDKSIAAQIGSSIGVFGIIGMSLGYVLIHKGSMKDIKKSHKVTLAIYGIFFTYFMNSDNYWTLFAHNIGFILGIILYIILYFLIFKRKEITKETN